MREAFNLWNVEGFVPGSVGVQEAYDFTTSFKISIAQVRVCGMVISYIQVVGTQTIN